MKIRLLFSAFALASFLHAQQRSFVLQWSAQELDIEGRSMTIDGFQQPYFDFTEDSGIQFVWRWKDSQALDANGLVLSNAKYETVQLSQLRGINPSTIGSSHQLKAYTSSARGERQNMIALAPVIREQGVLRRLVSFDISYRNVPLNRIANSQVSNRRVRSSSVLATGDWYRFFVVRSGVYRISRDFLASLGMNVGTIDPRNLKIYGNGGRMVPLLNQDVEQYDVAENAIQVIGEEDGVFNSGDYILFYAEGPDKYNAESRTHINLFTDRTYYYITASGGNGKRIQEAIEPPGVPETTYTTYNAYQYVEEDRINIAKIGRRWFGDVFSIENTRTYDFEFPNRVSTEPVTITANPAAISSSPTSLSFAIGLNPGATSDLIFNFPALPPSSETSQATENGLKTSQPTVTDNGDLVRVTATYDNSGNPSSASYLDFLAVEATCGLSGFGKQFDFRVNAMGNNLGVASIALTNAQQIQAVWDITDLYNVVSHTNTDASTTFSYSVSQGSVQEYVAVDQQDYFTPQTDSNPRVDNQNIKGTVFFDNGQEGDVDYLIFTSRALLPAAERLADLHRQKSNLQVRVYDVQDVYDEFNTGNPDIGAIRNMVKYVYDNATTPENRVKYICLFGDTSYDYKNRTPGNNNIVPTFHAYNSFSLTSSVMSDDYFGMMDPQEGSVTAFNNLLDVAVGRILADDLGLANTMVDKIEAYHSPEAYGRWRNNVIMLSDDMDDDWEWELEYSTNRLADALAAQKPFINVRKVYADAFEQTSSAGGNRYFEATQRLLNDIELGALAVVYLGHGGEDGLAAERLFQQPDAQGLFHPNKYNVFVTATCEFTRFDNPERLTAGEFTLWNPRGGSIGLISTTRRIFAQNGISYNDFILNYLFRFGDAGIDNNYDTVAEALRKAKTDPGFTGATQKRVVFYLGDPALRLSIPQPQVRLTHVNDIPVESTLDTLKALSRAKLRGVVTDETGTVIPNFNGTVSANIFDKNIDRRTLANDNVRSDSRLRDTLPDGTLIIGPTVYRMPFETSGETIFRGKAAVDPSDSSFEVEFVVPRDISIPVGEGRASFYATQEGREEDYTGSDVRFLVGELDETAPEDNVGPTIQLYMNDENFVSGGITNDSPILLGLLEDENGINTASGIGHDIIAILDGDEVNPFVLNDYYEADENSFASGRVVFPFRDLEPGLHTLTLRAWDVYNNSATAEIQFVVVGEDEIQLENVLNYPNPFTSYTEFWFQHNRPAEPLDVLVQVFTVSGKLVWSRNQQITTDGFLSREISWDGRDDFGDRIGKGVYVYKITVRSTFTNKTAEKIEKLVIL